MANNKRAILIASVIACLLLVAGVVAAVYYIQVKQNNPYANTGANSPEGTYIPTKEEVEKVQQAVEASDDVSGLLSEYNEGNRTLTMMVNTNPSTDEDTEPKYETRQYTYDSNMTISQGSAATKISLADVPRGKQINLEVRKKDNVVVAIWVP